MSSSRAFATSLATSRPPFNQSPRDRRAPNKARLQIQMTRAQVLRADRKPAYATRRTGYVTEALIRQHGSFAKALAVLNAQA